eukprot:3924898-Rhodomonas_salina.4
MLSRAETAVTCSSARDMDCVACDMGVIPRSNSSDYLLSGARSSLISAGVHAVRHFDSVRGAGWCDAMRCAMCDQCDQCDQCDVMCHVPCAMCDQCNLPCALCAVRSVRSVRCAICDLRCAISAMCGVRCAISAMCGVRCA